MRILHTQNLKFCPRVRPPPDYSLMSIGTTIYTRNPPNGPRPAILMVPSHSCSGGVLYARKPHRPRTGSLDTGTGTSCAARLHFCTGARTHRASSPAGRESAFFPPSSVLHVFLRQHAYLLAYPFTCPPHRKNSPMTEVFPGNISGS